MTSSPIQPESNETQQLLRKTYIGTAITIVLVAGIISMAMVIS